ncbi:hypothetical protein C5746_05855 [Streptomyces atratus]|uniref:Uncharacterized protein n=1 Tax=Streptomyces atratus TaxID=1893 RepID=A0A2Z5J856_STRAR|nr:hypothetical protein C5746_05855 [Streptomyces atratus]
MRDPATDLDDLLGRAGSRVFRRLTDGERRSFLLTPVPTPDHRDDTDTDTDGADAGKAREGAIFPRYQGHRAHTLAILQAMSHERGTGGRSGGAPRGSG